MLTWIYTLKLSVHRDIVADGFDPQNSADARGCLRAIARLIDQEADEDGTVCLSLEPESVPRPAVVAALQGLVYVDAQQGTVTWDSEYRSCRQVEHVVATHHDVAPGSTVLFESSSHEPAPLESITTAPIVQGQPKPIANPEPTHGSTRNDALASRIASQMLRIVAMPQAEAGSITGAESTVCNLLEVFWLSKGHPTEHGIARERLVGYVKHQVSISHDPRVRRDEHAGRSAFEVCMSAASDKSDVLELWREYTTAFLRLNEVDEVASP